MASETVLITGASAGIGLELARLFAADKSNLVLVARRHDRLTRLADELHARHGVTVQTIAADLAEPQAPQSIYEQLAASGVAVDVVVNNAGFGAVGSIAELPLQRQLDMIQVNITSLAHLTRLFLPAMLGRGRGGVLNVGSTAAFQPGPFLAVYYATKAFVLSFTEALAEELAGTAVHVTCLCPGPTATEFAAEAKLEDSLLFRFPVMDSASVAKAAYRGFRRGKVIIVPGLLNRAGTVGVRLAPRWLVRKITRRLQWKD
jgi:short-subunit dehydrogenase